MRMVGRTTCMRHAGKVILVVFLLLVSWALYITIANEVQEFSNDLAAERRHGLGHTLRPHPPKTLSPGNIAAECPKWSPAKDKVITRYAKSQTNNCTSSLCDLNRGRSLVQYYERSEYCTKVSECVTVTVKTRHRLENVVNMIKSLHDYFPGTPVIVADEFDSDYDVNATLSWRKLYHEVNYGWLTYFQTRPGVGSGRDLAARAATTKYVLIADDDYVFTKDTNLSTLLYLLEQTDLSIASGATDDTYPFDGVFRVWQHPIERDKSHLEVYSGVFYEALPCFKNCYSADIVKNFFLADRNAILRAGSWDQYRLFYEHEDFFFQMRRAGLKVAYCSDVVIHHDARDRGLANKRKVSFNLWREHLKKKWKLASYYYCKKETYLTAESCTPDRLFS